MSCFFYGTLMHTQVLERVTASNRHKYIPAMLKDHARCVLKGGQDYPGLVPRKGHSVQGMLVIGLTPSEIERLDLFEGDEYDRSAVVVQSLGSNESIACETYIYRDQTALEDREWDFASFQKDKLHRWTGVGGEAEYDMLGESATGGRIAFA